MTRGIWILALLLGLGGCRFAEPEPPPAWAEELKIAWKDEADAEAEPRPLAERTLRSEISLPAAKPAPYRVGVLLPRYDYDAAKLYADDPTRNASKPDALQFRREIVQALRAASVFTRVEPRGAPEDARGAIETEAWLANDDLLLELELLDYHQAFLEHGQGYLPWVATYVTWVWPAWWVPSETFGGGLVLRVRLRDVQGRHDPLVEEVIRVGPKESKLDLTPIERGLAGLLDLGAIYNLQESLERENWQGVEKRVGPRNRRQLHLRLLETFWAQVLSPLMKSDRALSSRTTKRLGLVAGVTKGSDPRLGDGAHAVADARAIASLWATPAGGGLVPGRELKTLLGEQATRSEVLASIAAIGSRANSSDEVIVYLAGQGTTTKAGPSLLLHDANLDDLAGTSLSLADLAAALRGLEAERVLLILDASFSQPGAGGRTFAGTEAGFEAEQVRQLLALGPGRTVILAAQPGEGARVLESGESGLFTQVLKEGVAGRADTDQDGRVTLRELYEHVRLEVSNRAALERHEQTPLAIGLPDLDPQDEEAQESQFGWPR